MATFSMLSLLCVGVVHSFSACDPVDVTFLVDTASILYSENNVLSLINSIIRDGSSEDFGLSVVLYGDVPNGQELMVLALEETQSIHQRRAEEQHARDALLSAFVAVRSAHRKNASTHSVGIMGAFEIATTQNKPQRNHSKAAKIQGDGYTVDRNDDENEYFVFDFNNALFDDASNDDLCALLQHAEDHDDETMHFLLGQEQDAGMVECDSGVSVSNQSLFVADSNLLESTRLMEAIYSVTCPSWVDVPQWGGRMNLGNHVQWIDEGVVMECHLVPIEHTDKAKSVELDMSESYILVKDFADDENTFKAMDYLVAYPDVVAEIETLGCWSGAYRIMSIQEQFAVADSPDHTVLRLAVAIPSSPMEYISHAHVSGHRPAFAEQADRRQLFSFGDGIVESISGVFTDFLSDFSPNIEQNAKDIVSIDFDQEWTYSKEVGGAWQIPEKARNGEFVALLTTNGSFELTGGYTLALSMDLDFKLAWDLASSEGELVLTISFPIDFNIYFNVDMAGSLNLALNNIISWKAFYTFFIGPVPVIIEPYAQLDASLTAVPIRFKGGVNCRYSDVIAVTATGTYNSNDGTQVTPDISNLFDDGNFSDAISCTPDINLGSEEETAETCPVTQPGFDVRAELEIGASLYTTISATGRAELDVPVRMTLPVVDNTCGEPTPCDHTLNAAFTINMNLNLFVMYDADLSAIGDLVNDALAEIRRKFDEVSKDVLELLGSLVTGMADVAEGAVAVADDMKQFFENVGGEIHTVLESIGEDPISFVNDALDEIGSPVDTCDLDFLGWWCRRRLFDLEVVSQECVDWRCKGEFKINILDNFNVYTFCQPLTDAFSVMDTFYRSKCCTETVSPNNGGGVNPKIDLPSPKPTVTTSTFVPNPFPTSAATLPSWLASRPTLMPTTRPTSESTTTTARTMTRATLPNANTDVVCGVPLTGNLIQGQTLHLTFANPREQTVLFTNCHSTFDTAMYLKDASGVEIQQQATNGCDGDDCSDDLLACDEKNHETFIMQDLAAGTYTIEIKSWNDVDSGAFEVQALCLNRIGCGESYSGRVQQGQLVTFVFDNDEYRPVLFSESKLEGHTRAFLVDSDSLAEEDTSCDDHSEKLNIDLGSGTHIIGFSVCDDSDSGDFAITVEARCLRAVLQCSNDGPWGKWVGREFCPMGKYATGFAIAYPADPIEGDDNGANALKLICEGVDALESLDELSDDDIDIDGLMVGEFEGFEGDQCVEYDRCPRGEFITAFDQKVDAEQGRGDDTGVVEVKALCSDGSYIQPICFEEYYEMRGSWANEFPTCPEGSLVCGFDLKVDSPIGDDTGVNAVEMICCDDIVNATGADAHVLPWISIFAFSGHEWVIDLSSPRAIGSMVFFFAFASMLCLVLRKTTKQSEYKPVQVADSEELSDAGIKELL